MPKATVRIDSLHHYPVKSLGGASLQQSLAAPTGLENDRRWMVINSRGKFVTQRQLPQMGAVKAHVVEGFLKLTHPSQGGCTPTFTESAPKTVKVWKDECQGMPADTATNAWLTHACNSQNALTLVQFDSNFTRPPQKARFDHQSTLFADAAPYLITNIASLEALNTALIAKDEPAVEMVRFRPNIVLSGLEAFTEHQVHVLKHRKSGACFQLVDHCQRCAIITINPHTHQPHPKQSPFKILATLNSMPNNAKAPAFGVNAMLDGEGVFELTVGDEFEAL